MTLINLPEPMQCPDSWKYTKEWQDQYIKKHGYDYLSKMCKHSDAQFQIMYYIYEKGEMALTKIKTQNLFIKRIAAGTADPADIRDHDIDWQSGCTWIRLDEMGQAVFEIYNAQLAPTDILKILGEVKAFMIAGQSHCKALLRYLANAREQKELEREQARLQVKKQGRTNKWDVIDVKHSEVTEGFVYLLSNALMPGIYKIGFTASNPDNRAREISGDYGLPMPFEVLEYWRTKDPYIVEQRIHVALASYKKAGEFFEVDLQFAKETIEAYIIKGAKVECKPETNAPQIVQSTLPFEVPIGGVFVTEVQQLYDDRLNANGGESEA